MNELNDAYEEYEKYYEHRKNEVCSRLLTIRNNCPNETFSKWLLDAINFIQEEHR
jgi:hypothetical protein